MTAKGKSWHPRNPGGVLKRLIAENPKAGKRKLLALFVEDINGRDGKGALDSVAKYWFLAVASALAIVGHCLIVREGVRL